MQPLQKIEEPRAGPSGESRRSGSVKKQESEVIQIDESEDEDEVSIRSPTPPASNMPSGFFVNTTTIMILPFWEVRHPQDVRSSQDPWVAGGFQLLIECPFMWAELPPG